jgi:GNAT superfamily N-acetyltransferase
MNIRRSLPEDFFEVLEIINDAASAYKGVIPGDRWHDPYMPEDELRREITGGIEFWVAEEEGRICGVMGIQDKGDVTLIRHAYVRTALRGRGVGTELLKFLESLSAKPVLMGTWREASWAVSFYQKHGYRMVSNEEKDRLLPLYWGVPPRQIETSVVLADKKWFEIHPLPA